MIGTYRGLRTVWHNGDDAGYRTIILQFPEQYFSVIILANGGDVDTNALADKVADIFLSGSFASQVRAARNDPPHVEVMVDPKMLDAVVGDYALSPGFIITFSRESGELFAQATGQRKYPVFWAADNAVFWKIVDAHFTFDAPDGDGHITGGVHHQNGKNMPAKKIIPRALTAEQIKDYLGDFYSAELRTIYTVTYSDGLLSVRYPRGEILLKPSGPDTFAGGFPIGALTFSRAPDGSCDGFAIDDGRVKKLRFAKVTITPVAQQP
jgi:hypothetical protein